MANRIRLKSGDLKQVRGRIEIAQNYYKQGKKETDSLQARDILHANLYKGDFTTEFAASLTERPVLNYLRRLVNLKVSSLASEPPILRFKPKGHSDYDPMTREMLAQVWEAVIPHEWRMADVHKHMKASLRDKCVFGRGWVAIDWRLETQETYAEGEGVPEGTLAPEAILFDGPSVTRISPKRLLIDPDVDTLTWEQAAFIVWEMRWPLDRIRRWAKGDKRVVSAVAERLKGDETTDKTLLGTLEADAGAKRATIYRYHDRDKGLVVYLPKEQDDPLMVAETYEFRGYPFEPLFGTPVLDKIDATGTIEEMRDWQRIKTTSRAKQLARLISSRSLIAIPSNTSEEDKQAIEAQDDRVMVSYDPGSQPPREINSSGFPPEVMQAEGMSQQDYTELGGVNAARRGLVEKDVNTATEASLLANQSAIGDQDEQAEWEDMNARVARKFKALLEQFGDAERFAGVTPETGQSLQDAAANPALGLSIQPGRRFTWIQYTPQRIRDEADIEVLAGSMGTRNEALERAQMTQAVGALTTLATSAPALQALGLDVPEVAKELFRRFGNDLVERFFRPLSAPSAVPGLSPETAPPGNGGPPTDGTVPTDLQGVVQALAQAGGPGALGG